jgi:hypothetical protein
MQVTYGEGFAVAPPQMMRQKVESLQQELSKLPQYEPETKHYFHGGMYCREVFRHAGVLVVGAIHKKEHFYLIVSGTVAITDGEGNVQEVTGPYLFQSKPGTKRAVYAVTDAICMTFHATEATTVEEAEATLVEADASTMYSLGNKVKVQELP